MIPEKEDINLYGLIFLLITGTILSALGVNFILLQYGITNDYILVNLQDISEDFEDQGVFPTSMNASNLTLEIGEAYQETIGWFDNLWFMVYVFFIVITFIVAYNIKQPSELN